MGYEANKGLFWLNKQSYICRFGMKCGASFVDDKSKARTGASVRLIGPRQGIHGRSILL